MNASVQPEFGRERERRALVDAVVNGVVSHKEPMNVLRQIDQGAQRGLLALSGSKRPTVPISHVSSGRSSPREVWAARRSARGAVNQRSSKGEGQDVALVSLKRSPFQALAPQVLEATHPSVHTSVTLDVPRSVFCIRNLHRLLHDQGRAKCLRSVSRKCQIRPVPNP